jgi:hypothetical protein
MRTLAFEQGCNAFCRDLQLVLEHVIATAICATQFESDECVAALDTVTRWALETTCENRESDHPVRRAALRLRGAADPSPALRPGRIS